MEINDHAVSYEQVQYVSMPFIASHPSTLAVAAAFGGVVTAPVEKCRVLEIGCAGGGNLLPMAAAFPNSRFVGVDMGRKHIDEALSMAEAAQLQNVELHCADICEFKPDETFDYILAHGFYSWVPAPVRDRLLKICADHLNPNGAAFISYMVYPGAYVYQALRHAMLLATAELPKEKVAPSARKAAQIIADISPKLAPRWGPVIAKWCGDMAQYPDHALVHDQLAPIYHPVYLTEFVEHASSNGLRYVTDVLGEDWSAFAAGMRSRIETAGFAAAGEGFATGYTTTGSIVPLQFLDIASFRMFRQSVLCHAESGASSAQPPRPVTDPLEVIERAYIASDHTLPPQPGAPKKPASSVPISKLDPLSRAALEALARRWPKTWRLEDLTREVGSVVVGRQERALASAILKLYELRYVELWMTEPVHIGDGSDPARVRTSPLARAQASMGKPVTSLRHLAFHGEDANARRVVAEADGRQPPSLTPEQIRRMARNSMLLA